MQTSNQVRPLSDNSSKFAYIVKTNMAVRRIRDMGAHTDFIIFHVRSTSKSDKVKRQQNGRACVVLMAVPTVPLARICDILCEERS
jgi:hypothetical protein